MDEREIQAAVQELFGNEGEEQEIISYQPNLMLSGDIEANNDLLNMDIILNADKSPAKTKRIKSKQKSPKLKSHLDDLLRKHKDKMKAENSSKIQIFKQKRKKKTPALNEPDQCFQCGKVFHYKGYLELHMRTHSNYKAFECNICNKKFTQVSNLNLHIRTHTKEKPFACERCPKFFSTSSNLNVHLKIHTGVKDHNCTQCSKTFKAASELKAHEGTHSQIKTKVCPNCGKKFLRTSYLNVHIKNIHFGLKKYKCDGFNCNKVFSNSSNLIAHKRIHTGDKPFVCQRGGCNAKFNQSSSLTRHIKSHNKIEKTKASLPEKEKSPPKIMKKTPYNIPEILKTEVTPSVCHDEPSRNQNNSSCKQDTMQTSITYPMPHQSVQTENQVVSSCKQEAMQAPVNTFSMQPLLPEALNPMNLINNSSSTSYNQISSHSASSLLLPLPPHHEPPQITDHQIHHFTNFDNTNYLTQTPNILPNSYSFIMGGLDFSKNSLNGEPTYINY